mmetsp:Transcript_5827/g.14903  ORF Transcript_5827/g.14903 Transcript_5827/m.14903 type:complete len:289 (+) Transcript_5827:628-1494(+)
MPAHRPGGGRHGPRSVVAKVPGHHPGDLAGAPRRRAVRQLSRALHLARQRPEPPGALAARARLAERRQRGGGPRGRHPRGHPQPVPHGRGRPGTSIPSQRPVSGRGESEREGRRRAPCVCAQRVPRCPGGHAALSGRSPRCICARICVGRRRSVPARPGLAPLAGELQHGRPHHRRCEAAGGTAPGDLSVRGLLQAAGSAAVAAAGPARGGGATAAASPAAGGGAQPPAGGRQAAAAPRRRRQPGRAGPRQHAVGPAARLACGAPRGGRGARLDAAHQPAQPGPPQPL